VSSAAASSCDIGPALRGEYEVSLLLSTSTASLSVDKVMPTYSRVAFDRLDRDGSGTIDIVELQALCKSLGRHLSRAELALAAQVLDCNGDGTIEYDEFLRWWRQGRQLGRLGSVGWKELGPDSLSDDASARLQQAIRYFEFFDMDESGSLSCDEFSKLHADLTKHGFTNLSLAECLVTLDTSGDGLVAFNEYCDWLETIGSLRCSLCEPSARVPLG